MSYPKAKQPTLYFIGVTTGKSSIMKVFPEWARHLQLHDATIAGIDFALHDKPERYREAVCFIKSDPLARGALVTTHKLDLLKACSDQFDELDEHASVTGEVSCLSKRHGRLVGHAKDVLTAGRALEAFLPAHYWAQNGAEVFVIGAGGSSIAITLYLMNRSHGGNRPAKVIVANRTAERLEEMQQIHRRVGCDIPVEYHHVTSAEQNDELVARLPPGSLVVNATGLGKDAPGSPFTDAARFPRDGIAWDFNYRGELLFLKQARSQAEERNLSIEDGWVYFIHGWTSVIAEVFDIDIATQGPQFEELSRIALATKG
jgi:shikimate 5-dehydrogenase